jgi:hypothetical protein
MTIYLTAIDAYILPFSEFIQHLPRGLLIILKWLIADQYRNEAILPQPIVIFTACQKGYRNLAKTISAASTGMRNGTLSKSSSACISGPVPRNHEFFWRGFNSPVGDLIGRAIISRATSSRRGGHVTGNRYHAGGSDGRRGRHFHHPYKKRF